MPISIPVIDMVEIGAGGGSLARVDGLHQIRVGPESAGSEPGPACYGRGGTRPAVTDADLILGRLDPVSFAGGTIPLTPDLSETALATHVGDALRLDPVTAAYGVSEVVDENMANAARVHAVENGEDLANYTMIAFGGAAPLHAARLCEKLGISRALVPPGAGVGSAIGFLRAPFSFEATRSVYMRVKDFNATIVQKLLAELREEATAFVRSCDGIAEIGAEYKVYMRYIGQGWEIPIALPPDVAANPAAGTFKTLFEAEYSALFGRIVDGLDCEITVWAVNAATAPSPAEPVGPAPASKIAWPTGMREIFSPASESFVVAPMVARVTLEDGDRVVGPAAITEAETTIILPPGFDAITRADGCIDITRNGGGQ
jgi:N-methylhydantoinase A